MNKPTLEVTGQSLALLDLATKARDKAHVPYSRFPVGVALRTRSGSIHVGCNIENASYPEGWCAETSAIAAMVMASDDAIESRSIEEVVVIADHTPPITPCGGCRQRLKEFGSADTVIHAADLGGIRQSFRLGDLLPAAFDLEENRDL
ncbi:cytidine deaminase [uncultured Cohaesibacter sp.]|uniref:cytidine deaminase n=1 Tax=uncultured Cohaesibacter sp. TaxID=1002546 RepID=UPI002931C5DA|nr:cytidine deaminase [uncultured Cohaesibacter sp.]